MTDPRVAAGLGRQLESWRAALGSGAQRVGWKIGFNAPAVQETCGISEPFIGYLTSATVVEAGGTYTAGEPTGLVAEPEIAVELGADVPPDADAEAAAAAISGYAPAIELADVHLPFSELEEIVAVNVFHRAVVFGPFAPAPPPAGAHVTLTIGGEERALAETPIGYAAEVRLTARLLAEHGERLRAGDRIITGALAPPPPAAAGDAVRIDVEALGTVGVAIA